MENAIGNNLESLRAFFIDNVSKFCDKCGTAYKPDNIDIVSESTASVIIQAQCDNCKGIYMAHVIKPLQMTKKVPIRLDIPHTALRSYYVLGPISSDELLSLRKKMNRTKSFDELMELFGEPIKKKAVKKTTQKATTKPLSNEA